MMIGQTVSQSPEPLPVVRYFWIMTQRRSANSAWLKHTDTRFGRILRAKTHKNYAHRQEPVILRTVLNKVSQPVVQK